MIDCDKGRVGPGRAGPMCDKGRVGPLCDKGRVGPGRAGPLCDKGRVGPLCDKGRGGPECDKAEQRPASSMFLRLNIFRFGYMNVIIIYNYGEE